jgi:hypothetical protein
MKTDELKGMGKVTHPRKAALAIKTIPLAKRRRLIAAIAAGHKLGDAKEAAEMTWPEVHLTVFAQSRTIEWMSLEVSE